MYDFDPKAAAAKIAESHATLESYSNLPAEFAPPTVNHAYAAQEALRDLWVPRYGPVKGLKIATTTKIMQELMGINHPCGGMIFERRIHTAPVHLKLGDFIHLMVECELGVRLGKTLADKGSPYTPSEVRSAVAEVMPAFELIEDRNAHYKSTNALSFIADNVWNGGIVLGPALTVAPDLDLNGIKGRLMVNGTEHGTGVTDNPMGALAWLANLAVERGRPIEAGMVVITGSVILTLPINAGDKFAFSLEGIGTTEMSAE